jgi:hypothetical protein
MKGVSKMAKCEFKVGDRVQFKEWDDMVNEFGKDGSCSGIKLSVPSPFFSAGMKHLCGTYATLKDFTIGGRVHLSDMTAKGDIGWSYHVDMLKPASTKKQKVDEPKKSPEPVYPPIVTAHIYPTITAHTIEGNKTTVMLSDGRMGEATCYYKDTFDPAVGLAEAYKKALGITIKSDKPKPKFEAGKKYVIGVKFWRTGEIIEITDYKWDNHAWLYRFKVVNGEPHSDNTFHEGSIMSDNLTPYIEPEVKEVKRTAKVGEWIKITNPTDDHYPEVNKGDILKVNQIVNTYVGTTSGNGFRLAEYVVLEGYSPAK